jgi:hypothetical protein
MERKCVYILHIIRAFKGAMSVTIVIHRLDNIKYESSDNCALLCYYVTNSGKSLPTFRDKTSVPSSRVKNS